MKINLLRKNNSNEYIISFNDKLLGQIGFDEEVSDDQKKEYVKLLLFEKMQVEIIPVWIQK